MQKKFLLLTLSLLNLSVFAGGGGSNLDKVITCKGKVYVDAANTLKEEVIVDVYQNMDYFLGSVARVKLESFNFYHPHYRELVFSQSNKNFNPAIGQYSFESEKRFIIEKRTGLYLSIAKDKAHLGIYYFDQSEQKVKDIHGILNCTGTFQNL